MAQTDIVSMFDKERAANYDAQANAMRWRATVNELALQILAPLPADAAILCVGVGTGLELLPLAEANKEWRFLALEPSADMLDVCRNRMREAGLENQCEFFHGYLEDLPPERMVDAATCLLVSQFMTEAGSRERFFREIAAHLRRGGLFINCDLASDQDTPQYAALEQIWLRMMQATTDEQSEKLRSAYRTLVSIRPPGEVAGMLTAAGFVQPTLFYQALLLHAWFAERA